MKKIILLSMALSAVFFSCKKDKDDPNPTSKSTTELLTAHGWKLESSTADKDVDVTDDDTDNKSSNVFNQMEACDRDDVITFTTASDGTKTGTWGVGATKCDAETDQAFTWALKNGDTQLDITYMLVNTDNYTILEIKENTLKVRYDDTDVNGTAYSSTDVYTKP